MRVIDVATVKALLGIADDSLDTAISDQIPFIDSKVKLITRNRWNLRLIANIESGSPYVEVVALYGVGLYGGPLSSSGGRGYRIDLPREASEYIEDGQLITGTGIPSGASIATIYEGGGTVTLAGDEYTTPVLELTDDTTATDTAAELFLGVPIGYQPLIAKAVYWAIQERSTTLPENGLFVKRMGPVSKNYGTVNAKLDGTYGVPAWLVKGLPRYHGGH